RRLRPGPGREHPPFRGARHPTLCHRRAALPARRRPARRAPAHTRSPDPDGHPPPAGAERPAAPLEEVSSRHALQETRKDLKDARTSRTAAFVSLVSLTSFMSLISLRTPHPEGWRGLCGTLR